MEKTTEAYLPSDKSTKIRLPKNLKWYYNKK